MAGSPTFTPTLMDLGAALSEVFKFVEGPRDVLHASATCRRWRALAGDEDIWWAKAEREFGRRTPSTWREEGRGFGRPKPSTWRGGEAKVLGDVSPRRGEAERRGGDAEIPGDVSPPRGEVERQKFWKTQCNFVKIMNFFL